MSQWKGIVGRGFSPEDFGDYVEGLQFGAWRPHFVVLHNTARPLLTEWHSTPGDQRMRNFEAYYRNEKGWSAGPHLFVADDLIWVFTPLTTPGVHSPSWNHQSWGVEMVGDYSREPFGGAVRDNAIAALTSLHAILGLNPDSLRFHKEDPKTDHDCPGKNVHKPDIISGVKGALEARTAGEHLPDRPA